MQSTDSEIRISAKSGTLLARVWRGDFFFEPADQVWVGDPRISWDPLHSRWLATEISSDCTAGHFYIVVSDGADLTGGWTSYVFDTPGLFVEAPTLGFSSDKFAVGMNVWSLASCGPGTFQGADLVAGDVAALLPEPMTLTVNEFGADANHYSWRPARAQAAGNDLHLVLELGTGPTYDVGSASVTGTLAAANLTLGTISDLTTGPDLVPGFSDPPAPRQPGSPGTISGAISGRVTDALFDGTYLWFVSTSPCTPMGDSTVRSCARFTELVASTSPATLRRDSFIGTNGLDTFGGAIGESGSCVPCIAYAQSSSSTPVSIYGSYADFGLDYTSNVFRSQALLVQGSDTYVGQSWGAYATLAMDPTDGSVWHASEYVDATGDWSTWLAPINGYGLNPGEGVFKLDSGRTHTNSLSISITANPIYASGAHTGTPGVTQVLLSNSSATSGGVLAQAKQFAPAFAIPWSLSDGSTGGSNATGLRTVYLQWGDGAGNWSGVISASITVDTPLGATFTALSPARLLDTRIGNGLSGPFHSAVPRTFQVTGRGGVPSGALAVTGNLTVTGQTTKGYVFLGPSATSTPGSSTINFPVGDNRANGVTVKLGSGGTLSAVVIGQSSSATAHLIVDVTGYFVAGDSGSTYTAINPTRILDSRDFGIAGKLHSSQWRSFIVGGLGGVPADAVAVTGNVTVTQQSSRGYLFLGPTGGGGPPTSSTINFPVGDNRANNLTVALGSSAELWVIFVGTSSTATTHFIFDVTGYFMAVPGGTTYVPLTPARLLDTRTGNGLSGPFTNKIARSFQVTGRGGVPGFTLAVTGNLTVTQQTAAGYVFLGPVPTNTPSSSTLNFPVSDNRANGVSVALGTGGALSATFAATPGATTHLIFDVTGYYR